MAGQDYTRTLQPGQVLPVPVSGDYVFCKVANRPFRLTITNGTGEGTNVTMIAGDNYRPGPFKELEIQNTDDQPLKIVLTIGEGNYNRLIVNGQISSIPGIVDVNGEVVADTRKTLTLDAITTPGTGITETFGQTVLQTFQNTNKWAFALVGGSTFQTDPDMINYSPEVHDGIMVMGQRQSDNQVWLLEVDPVNETLIKDWGIISDLGQPSGATRYGDILYQKNTFGTKGVYRRLPGESWELIYATGSSNGGITVDKDGNVLVASYNAVIKIGPDGTVIASADYGNYVGSVAVDAAGNVWAFGDANYRPKVYDADLVYLRDAENIFKDESGVGIYGPYFVQLLDNHSVRFAALETVTDVLAGKATLACENAWLGRRPSAFESVRTTAAITVTNAETGNPTVGGELIKLVYEWYTGGPAPADYLDYVHAIRITGATDINGTRFPVREVASNGRTFAAADIKDDFRAVFPITATITIDDRANV